VQNSLYDKFVCVFIFELFYGRFIPPHPHSVFGAGLVVFLFGSD
jgi:hypothetical protein